MSLKRFLCETLPTIGRATRLSDTEATHAIKVLRLKTGDCVQLLDGRGRSGVGILKIKNDGLWVELSHEDEGDIASDRGVYPITLESAILKGDAMQWMIEKATELGVSTFIPMTTQYTVVETGKKGVDHFIQRWQKISDQALKQCGRLSRLKIEPVMKLKELLIKYPASTNAPRYWCLENSDSSLLSQAILKRPTPTHARILIGPEGGFSDDEKSLLNRTPSCDSVSLGPLVTRAETAALFAISLLRSQFMKP